MIKNSYEFHWIFSATWRLVTDSLQKHVFVCLRKRDIYIFRKDFISLAGALHFEFISFFVTFTLWVTLAPILYIRTEFSCLQEYI
jgi:hypothetical protein